MNVEVKDGIPFVNGKIVVVSYSKDTSREAIETWVAKQFPGVPFIEQDWFGHEEPGMLVPEMANWAQINEFQEHCVGKYIDGDMEGEELSEAVIMDWENDTCIAVSLQEDIAEIMLVKELSEDEDDELKVGFFLWDWKEQFEPEQFNTVSKDIGEAVVMFEVDARQDSNAIAVVNAAVNIDAKGEAVRDAFLQFLLEAEMGQFDETEHQPLEEYFNGNTYSIPLKKVAEYLIEFEEYAGEDEGD